MILIVTLLWSILSAAPIVFGQTNSPNSSVRTGDKSWFQSTEQSLMDAIAIGDKAVWDRILDEECIYTSEDGQTLSKEQLLKELTGLPSGLTGSIRVEELTVQEFPTFAVVRFLANEQENVFGQQLRTKYRVTDTFRKSGSQWKLIASHLSVVPSKPPAQEVSKENWPGLTGVYKLMPDGWTFHVVLRNGELFGGRDVNKLRPLIPLAENVFVSSGVPGEKIFIVEKNGKASRIVDFRKFQSLIWKRISDSQ